MPDPDTPRGRSAVRRSAAFVEHVLDHDESVTSTDRAALSDLLWAARQWVDSPDPDAGTVFGVPLSKVRHQFELAQSVTGEADPNLAMLAALRMARDSSAPSERARIAEAQGMVAPGSVDLESVLMAARQAYAALRALEAAKDEAGIGRGEDLAGWVVRRRDWVPPIATREGSAVLAPEAVAALDDLCSAMGREPVSRGGVNAVDLFEDAARAVRRSQEGAVRRVRLPGPAGVTPSPLLSAEPGSGPADESGTAHVHGRDSGGVSEEVALVALLQAFDGEWHDARDGHATPMVSLPRDTVDRARRFIADTVGWPHYEQDETAARAFEAVRKELGCAKDAGPTAVLRRAAEVREYARSFEKVARTVGEGSFYRSLVVSKVEEAWSQCRALVPMIAEHCSEDEAGGIGGDGPSVEVLERTLRELLGSAARCSFAEETVMLARVACGQGDQVVAEHVEADGNGSFATASEAMAADAGAWAKASRTVLVQHVEEAHAAWTRAPGLHGTVDGLRAAVARLLGTGAAPETGLAEVVDLVEQLRPMVAPSSPSAVGVLYAARNRLSVLEGASQAESMRVGDRPEQVADEAAALARVAGCAPDLALATIMSTAHAALVEAQARQDAHRANMRDAGVLLGLCDPHTPRDQAPPAVDVVTAVRALAVKAKARTTVVTTALLPGPGSRESRAVSQHVLHVEPGGPDAQIDLTIPWGVLDGRFGPHPATPSVHPFAAIYGPRDDDETNAESTNDEGSQD